ncbi:hypothetical protein TKK_0002786 [Trichogramma kaykai]
MSRRDGGGGVGVGATGRLCTATAPRMLSPTTRPAGVYGSRGGGGSSRIVSASTPNSRSRVKAWFRSWLSSDKRYSMHVPLLSPFRTFSLHSVYVISLWAVFVWRICIVTFNATTFAYFPANLRHLRSFVFCRFLKDSI